MTLCPKLLKKLCLSMSVFLKEISCAHQGCIYLIKKKYYNKYYDFKINVIYLNIYKNVMYYCSDKAEFVAAFTPVFSVTCFINHSNMLIFCLNISYHQYFTV